MPERITDPIDRIVDLVFGAQGDMTLNQLCLPGVREFIVSRVRDGVSEEFRRWFNAELEIMRLEEQSAGR